MRSPYRVGVVGPGGLGLCAIREVMRMPEYELVSVLAYSPDKNGKDISELTGTGETGVTATTDFNAFLANEMECVLFCGRDFGDWRSDDEIIALLEAGVNVITMLPYHLLSPRGEEIEARFNAAMQKGNSTLHGSGITPGFFNERLAMLMTGLSNDIEHIKFQEFFNAEPLAGAVETLQMFGFGSEKEVADRNVVPAMLAENYLRLPMYYAAEKLGLEIEKIERTPQMMVAPEDIVTPSMTVKKGTVGTVSYSWTGYVNGKPWYTTEAYWFLGDIMRPESCVGNDFWTIQIEGRPSLDITVASKASYKDDIYIRPEEPTPPGYIITIVAMVQAIPVVVDAEPGLLKPALPQFHWKPDQRSGH